MKSRSAEGSFQGKGKAFALVCGRFNQDITEQIVEGARHGLAKNGVTQIKEVWVPGAFELPLIAKQLAASGQYAGVICMGAVIRGETAHFEYVSASAAQGILQAGLDTGVPIIFSVLTTDTWEQAQARCRDAGFHGALAALEMSEILEGELCGLKS